MRLYAESSDSYNPPEPPNPMYNDYKQDYDYITDPTETRARLNQLRYLGKKNNIYDPYNEKVTPEILRKLIKLNPYNSLLDHYDHDKLINLLNTVSHTEPKNEDTHTNIAKHGGWLSAYQKGGIVSAEEEYLNSLALPEVNTRQEYLDSFKVAALPEDTPNERLVANKNIANQLMSMSIRNQKKETPTVVYINQAPIKETSIKEIPKEVVDETPVNMNSKQFSVGDVAKIAKKVGFNDNDAATIAAIAMRESGGNPLVDTKQSGLDPNMNREYSIGLTQINWKAHKGWLKNIGITNPDQLRDPETNLKAALALYKKQGSFTPWSGSKLIQQSDVDKAKKALGIFKNGGWLNSYK